MSQPPQPEAACDGRAVAAGLRLRPRLRGRGSQAASGPRGPLSASFAWPAQISTSTENPGEHTDENREPEPRAPGPGPGHVTVTGTVHLLPQLQVAAGFRCQWDNVT